MVYSIIYVLGLISIFMIWIIPGIMSVDLFCMYNKMSRFSKIVVALSGWIAPLVIWLICIFRKNI